MIIDVKRLAEEAELKSPDGNYRYRAIDRRIETFANLVLECAAIEAEKFAVGPMERAQAQTAIQTACAIRALKVKP